MSLSLGQTMALIFPPDDPKGARRLLRPLPAAAAAARTARVGSRSAPPGEAGVACARRGSLTVPHSPSPRATRLYRRVPRHVRAVHKGGILNAGLHHRPRNQRRSCARAGARWVCCAAPLAEGVPGRRWGGCGSAAARRWPSLIYSARICIRCAALSSSTVGGRPGVHPPRRPSVGRAAAGGHAQPHHERRPRCAGEVMLTCCLLACQLAGARMTASCWHSGGGSGGPARPGCWWCAPRPLSPRLATCLPHLTAPRWPPSLIFFSPQVPFENAERIAARLPHARLHKWEGWGHGFKDAAAFAAAINKFLCGE